MPTHAQNLRKQLLPDDDGSAIMVDLYESSGEQIVRLDIQSNATLRLLQDFVTEFSDSGQQSASLKSLSVLRPLDPMTDVVLRKVEKQSREFSRVRKGVLELGLTGEGWLEAIDMIKSLMNGGGHQYLNPPGKSGIEIELSVNE